MSSRIKEHQDHTRQSIFHHGLIKLIIKRVLQKEGKTWEYFIFWSGFQNSQEGQSTRKQADKGQTLIKKLRQKIKVENEDCVKLEEVAKPAKEDCESKQHLNDNKDLQSINKETQPVQDDAPAETFVDENIVLAEKVLGDEEDTKVQKQSPITILSEDETYLFEEDKIPVIGETKVGTKKEFQNSQEDRVAVPTKKKLKVMEFSIFIHQGKNLKMVGELDPGWRPKTRPRNKLRLNMKKLLNPKLSDR